jgi:hypothetical protein
LSELQVKLAAIVIDIIVYTGPNSLKAIAFLLGIGTMSGQSVKWADLGQSPISPRCCSGMAYDPAEQGTVLFGGLGPGGQSGDTWIYRSSAWSQLSPATSPPPREGPGMVYDAAAQNIVMFGGLSSSGVSLSDTWTWDGTTWTQQFPPLSPPGRRFDTQGMAYDAATQTAVFFGGIQSDDTVLGDTWTWNGIAETWTEQFPASAPSPWRTMIAYDGLTNNVVLFGGDDGAAEYNDTWTWDGTTWTQQFPATSPPARVDGAIAFDPQVHGVILFGGYVNTDTDSLNDTWFWDGTNWTRAHPTKSPTARYSSAMAYAPGLKGLLLFGGFSPGPALSDTWLFRLEK